MADGSHDPKRDIILDAAKEVFLRYGFSRTTMDDIARGAEISRPALYLHFRNKGDIYRALAMRLLAHGFDAAQKALHSDAPFRQRLVSAMRRGMFDLLDAVDCLSARSRTHGRQGKPCRRCPRGLVREDGGAVRRGDHGRGGRRTASISPPAASPPSCFAHALRHHGGRQAAPASVFRANGRDSATRAPARLRRRRGIGGARLLGGAAAASFTSAHSSDFSLDALREQLRPVRNAVFGQALTDHEFVQKPVVACQRPDLL